MDTKKTYTMPQIVTVPLHVGVFGDYGNDDGGCPPPQYHHDHHYHW